MKDASSMGHNTHPVAVQHFGHPRQILRSLAQEFLCFIRLLS